jgi:hypothetical protein
VTFNITVSAGGPKNATTDPETGLRYYEWKGQKLPSSTSLRRMAGLPFKLHQWAISKVVQRAVDENAILRTMLDRPKRPRERVRDKNVAKEASKWLRSAATEERDAAAELGTYVHDAAVHRTPLSQVDPIARPYLIQFYDWITDSGGNIVATEKQVFNLTEGYAGTFDLLVEWPLSGDIGVIDLKTGSGTYSDHALQLMSYAMGEFIGEDDVIDVALTDALHRANTMALLHLREDGWHYQRVPASPQLFAAFKGLIAYAVKAARTGAEWRGCPLGLSGRRVRHLWRAVRGQAGRSSGHGPRPSPLPRPEGLSGVRPGHAVQPMQQPAQVERGGHRHPRQDHRLPFAPRSEGAVMDEEEEDGWGILHDNPAPNADPAKYVMGPFPSRAIADLLNAQIDGAGHARPQRDTHARAHSLTA